MDTPGSTKSDKSDAASEKSSTSTSSSVFGIAPLKTPRDVNRVFAPSLRATSSKAKRTVSESSDNNKTTAEREVNLNRTESENRVCADPRSQRVPEVETVVPEPIVESGPVELAAAEEEEAAQGRKHGS